MKMYRIRCMLPNCSAEISGIAFKEIDGGVESVEAHPDDVAGKFQGINGYEVIEISQNEQKPRGRTKKQAD